LEALSQHSSGGTEENNDQVRRFSGAGFSLETSRIISKSFTRSTSTLFENQHMYVWNENIKNCWHYQTNIACTLSVEVYLASQTLGPLWKTTGWPRELTATQLT
jgi:hypothetical protein